MNNANLRAVWRTGQLLVGFSVVAAVAVMLILSAIRNPIPDTLAGAGMLAFGVTLVRMGSGEDAWSKALFYVSSALCFAIAFNMLGVSL